MRYLKIIVLTLILTSCNREKSTKPSFDLVDVTISNGWTDVYSLKVYQDGQIYILNNRIGARDKYFRFTVGKNELDSISKLTEQVLKQDYDTLYDGLCEDCGTFNIIIKSPNKTVQCYVIGINDNEQIPLLNQLVIFLYSLADHANNKIDSLFVFESRTKGFYPAPPPPPLDSTIKYLPPDIK